jgi:hypothetical protein
MLAPRRGRAREKRVADITQLRKVLVARILEGTGRVSHAQRRAAFDNAGLAEPLRTLIDKVAQHAYTVTDEDIAAARTSRLSEDQIRSLGVCRDRSGNAAIRHGACDPDRGHEK